MNLKKKPENETYKPLQRLDFVHFINRNSVSIRAKLVVPLHENESITPPKSVKTTGLYNSLTLIVNGDATGPIRLCNLEYHIEFIQKLKSDTEEFVRHAIKTKLHENFLKVFVVNTKVTKNPTEEVTNTISEDADIEVRR